MLVPQVYSVCAIGPSSFKGVQLVPQVLKLSCISPLLTVVSGVTCIANETMT